MIYTNRQTLEGGDGANYIGLGQTHTDNFYAGIKASYEYKDLFAISAGGTYYHWNADAQTTGSKSSDYNEALLMKPEFDLGIHTEIHPIAALWLNAGYQYTAGPNVIPDLREKYSCRQQPELGSHIQNL